MNEKISGLDNTFKMLEEIDLALESLKKNVQIKQSNVKNIKQITKKSIEKIDNLVLRLDKVIKNNGSSNNNN